MPNWMSEEAALWLAWSIRDCTDTDRLRDQLALFRGDASIDEGVRDIINERLHECCE